MGAYFKMGRAGLESDYVPRVGEVCMHEQPLPLPDRVVVGDGKTAAKDLPSLQPLDIYSRVQRLEEEVERLRNGAVEGCEAVPNQDSRTWETYPSNQTAPPCVETDGFSSGSRSGQINRSPERQSPGRECGESSLRDDTHPDTKGRATGGPEHNTLSRAEIDAIQHVVEDGRLFDMSDYGYLRSLLVRLRPEWEEESDRSEPIANGPDADSRVWETPAKTDPTPPRNGTPAEGTVQYEGSVPDSSTENGPVAWWVKGVEYDTGCDFEYVSLAKEGADAAAADGCTVTPMYCHPADPCAHVVGKSNRYCTLTPFTLTDAEKEAVTWCRDNIVAMANPSSAFAHIHAATLRALLERTK